MALKLCAAQEVRPKYKLLASVLVSDIVTTSFFMLVNHRLMSF